MQCGVAGLITVIEHGTLRSERSLQVSRVLPVDTLDQPGPRVCRGREHQVLLQDVVKIDVPTITAMKHSDRPALVDAGPELLIRRIFDYEVHGSSS
jgi:hypothetical protein